MAVLQVRIDAELHAQLTARALECETTVSELAREILAQGLARAVVVHASAPSVLQPVGHAPAAKLAKARKALAEAHAVKDIVFDSDAVVLDAMYPGKVIPVERGAGWTD